MIALLRKGNILITLLSILFVSVERAEAYIDPGTGSMILQATIAAIVGSAVTLKLFWQRIKIFFLHLIGKDKPNNSDIKK